MSNALLQWDSAERARLGLRLLAGVDEAGRGPLAGPVVAAVVILAPDCALEGLRDSKQLSSRSRAALEPEIRSLALAWALAEVDAARIDQINILQATFEAMGKAVSQLTLPPEYLLVDGRDFPFAGRPGRSVIRGDDTSACIAAASILAKEHRDRLMCRAALDYPGYGFEQHKGYGTAKHLEALHQRGPCPLHRRSFRPLSAAQGTLSF